MTVRTITAAAALLVLAGVARADGDGVLVYAPSFFADARPNTAADMIYRLPGFSLDSGDSARGFAGTAGNVLIDGARPTAKNDDIDSILNRISAASVERIEVIRGGAPGIDMHGQSVVANVILKREASTQIVVDAQDHFWPDGHSVPNLKLEYNHRNGDYTYAGSLYMSGGYDDSVGTGFYRITDAATGAVQQWDARSTGRGNGWGMTGAATLPLLGGSFKANLAYSHFPYHSGLYYTAPGNDITILNRSVSKSGELGLNWTGKFGDKELETIFLQRLSRSTYINTYDAVGSSQLFASKNIAGETIGRAVFRYNPSAKLSFETGLEGAYNFLDGTSRYSENDVDVALPSANADVAELRAEAFGQATWKFADGWTAEGGVRLEYSRISETGDVAKSRTFFYPKPRLLLSWSPRQDMQLRLRVERIVGQLDFGDFVATSNLGASGVSAGNPDLAPDRHSEIEVSYQYDFWKKGSLSLSYEHDEVSGVIDNVPVTGSSGVFDAPGNIGRGTGNDFEAALTLPLDRIGIPNGRLKLSSRFSFTRVRDPETGVLRGFSGNRPSSITATFTQDVESLKSTWGLFFYNCWDEYYYRLTEVRHYRTIPPYVEFWWEYKPTAAWTLMLAVNNWLPFSLNDSYERYAGPRAGLVPNAFTELKIKSQPTLHLRIRKVF